MPDPDEPTKDEIIEALQAENAELREENVALSKSNANISKLLAISRHQIDHLKEQCIELRRALAESLSKNTS